VAAVRITAADHVSWNNAVPLGFGLEAYDGFGNDLGDVTAQALFSVWPDGSCVANACWAATAGPHTVTGGYGTLRASVVVDATPPIPTVAPNLPAGEVGVAYSQSVLSYRDATTLAWLDASSALPPGLTLGTDGVLSGTPTTAGTYSFSVITRNDEGSQNMPTTITIAPSTTPAPTPTPSPAPTPKVSVSGTSVREGNSGRSLVRVTIRLSAASRTPVTVSGRTVNGTAVAGQDYVAEQGTVTIPAGRLSVTVPIWVIGDKAKERNETFTVVLTSANGATLGTARSTVTISNDD
jgi:hypothetical protein